MSFCCQSLRIMSSAASSSASALDGGSRGDLDGDVILMAQARAEDAAVVTSNTRHFEALVPTMDWPLVPIS